METENSGTKVEYLFKGNTEMPTTLSFNPTTKTVTMIVQLGNNTLITDEETMHKRFREYGFVKDKNRTIQSTDRPRPVETKTEAPSAQPKTAA